MGQGAAVPDAAPGIGTARILQMNQHSGEGVSAVAKIHVGKTLMSNRSLATALSMSSPGDELIIHEGAHRLDQIQLNGIHLVGSGDPSEVVIEARLDVWAESRVSNLTLRSPHFSNAIYLRRGDARVDLANITVHGDPAGKYPAIYGDGGTLVMTGCTVHASSSVRSIRMTKAGYLHAVDSRIERLCLEGGRAVLAHVHATTIEGFKGAKIEGFGRVRITPVEGRHFLTLSGESVCTLPTLSVDGPPCDASCHDSFLQIGAVDLPDGKTLRVAQRGHAVVECDSDLVSTYDPEAPPAAKVVRWHLADNRSFRTAVAPRLRAGDTVELDEGEYFLDDYADTGLGLGVNVIGTGADKTIIHGTLYVMEDREVTLTNMTVRASPAHNGIVNRSGGSLTMRDVIVDSTSSEYPSVYLAGGITTMTNFVVTAAADSRTGVTAVEDGATLEAAKSSLGWLWVNGKSTAQLSSCASMQLCALDDSAITAHASHLIQNNVIQQRHVVAEVDSTIIIEALTTDAPGFEAYASASTLEIGWVQTPEDTPATVLLQEGARAQVDGDTVTITNLDAADEGATAQAATLASPATPYPPDDAEDEMPGIAEDAADQVDELEHLESQDPLAEVDALTGLIKVKEQVRKFTRMVQYNQLRAQQGKPTTTMVMHSLFLGNPGTGKTTVARLLGKALFQAGAIPTETFIEAPGRAALVGDTIGSSAKLTTAVLEQARGGVLFIDEAYSLYKPNNNEFAQEAVDTILTFMENHRDEIVVIFAGYGEQMLDLLGMNPGLQSRVTNRFDFEDYSPAEVAEIGYQELVSGDHTVNEALYRRVIADEYRRTSDRSNGRWARNFNQELVSVLVERVLDSPDDVDISHITDEDLQTVAGGNSADKEHRVQELLDELDAMIGLEPVKEWVRRLVNRVKIDRRRMERDGTSSRPTYHTVFAGNPGTGKTTVARIVAELFHHLGILATPTVKEVNRDKLIGQYIGHTERNTTKAIDEAMGGVLFVDEAYELLGQEGARDFGRQVIGTLLPRLENDRDKFVAIFAGYSQEMEEFLQANPGLPSRVPHWIEFPDYTPDEVAAIVASRMSQQWTFDAAHLSEVVSAAYAVTDNRANGRWARNFIEVLEEELNEYLVTHDVPDAQLDHIPAEVIDHLRPQGAIDG